MTIKVIIVIGVTIAAFVMLSYNTLTRKKNMIEQAELELKKYEEEGTDRDIDNAKKYLTAVIKEYNNKVESFPTSIVAEIFSFPKMHSDNFDEGL
ncbi:MAG: LemA family protein [Clostridiales bacterium]|nr:LemA family protein [Clostridiales bacterium]